MRTCLEASGTDTSAIKRHGALIEAFGRRFVVSGDMDRTATTAAAYELMESRHDADYVVVQLSREDAAGALQLAERFFEHAAFVRGDDL